MSERLDLRVGEERTVGLPSLPPPGWRVQVEGMRSAVEVRRMWQAQPYPEDDEQEGPPGQMVYALRAKAPGHAVIRFDPPAPRIDGGREIEVTVRI